MIRRSAKCWAYGSTRWDTCWLLAPTFHGEWTCLRLSWPSSILSSNGLAVDIRTYVSFCLWPARCVFQIDIGIHFRCSGPVVLITSTSEKAGKWTAALQRASPVLNVLKFAGSCCPTQVIISRHHVNVTLASFSCSHSCLQAPRMIWCQLRTTRLPAATMCQLLSSMTCWWVELVGGFELFNWLTWVLNFHRSRIYYSNTINPGDHIWACSRTHWQNSTPWCVTTRVIKNIRYIICSTIDR